MRQFRISHSSARFVVQDLPEFAGYLQVEYFHPGRAPEWKKLLAAVLELGKELEVAPRDERDVPENADPQLPPRFGGFGHRIEFVSRPTRWRGRNFDLDHVWQVNQGPFCFEQRRRLAHIHVSSADTANGRISANLPDLLLLVRKIQEELGRDLVLPDRVWLVDEGEARPRYEPPVDEEEEERGQAPPPERTSAGPLPLLPGRAHPGPIDGPAGVE